ncbi:protein-tyrosine-phosphatase [Cytophagaceae bacterium ABcell3]|nr:protein-tyrosine-phosphatase [Cytophagaceae bacterium ABcell3]
MKNSPAFFSPLQNYIDEIKQSYDSISNERSNAIKDLATHIDHSIQSGGNVKLNFICTHNSRRSHLGQIWSATAAAYHGIQNILTYSGGTETTAFNPRAVDAIKRAGFHIENPGGNNPIYKVYMGQNIPPMECFSKIYNDKFNPSKNFIAVMTCSDADKNCPIIPGAILRFPLRYKDPKEADNTPMEQERYDERCRQIATEMFYLMSIIKNKK